ncbi:hypothetical protein GCM10020216_016120 [Nonomuraea helvata]
MQSFDGFIEGVPGATATNIDHKKICYFSPPIDVTLDRGFTSDRTDSAHFIENDGIHLKRSTEPCAPADKECHTGETCRHFEKAIPPQSSQR